MIACGFEDVREHKPAVSGKNPVHPVHRCESKIYPCLTMNRFPATRRRRLFQASRAPAPPRRGGSSESETGLFQISCQFLSNPFSFNLLNRICVIRTRGLFQTSCQFLSNPFSFNLLNQFCVIRTQVLFQISYSNHLTDFLPSWFLRFALRLPIVSTCVNQAKLGTPGHRTPGKRRLASQIKVIMGFVPATPPQEGMSNG